MDNFSSSPRRFYRLLIRLKEAVYPERIPLPLENWSCPGDPVPFAEVPAKPFTAVGVGDSWGRQWGTTWFRFVASCPEQWNDRPLVARIDLGFHYQEGFSVEALIFRKGVPAGALNTNRQEILLSPAGRPGDSYEVYLEAAANPRVNQPEEVSAADPHLLADQESQPISRIVAASLCVRDESAFQFLLDLECALETALALPENAPRRKRLLRGLHEASSQWELDAGSPALASRILKKLLAGPPAASHVRVFAVGHAHIDTAWLWPLRETIRKCARTFSTQLDLMDRYPDFHFSCSQPVQYLWMRQYYPSIWEKILQKVKAGQWEPMGSMWVEPDCNIPGGESLLRQILYGKRFFKDEFGVETRDLWLPDAFGFSASLPQLLKHCGIDFFFSQKISWNDTNHFPHHSFWWIGIDGSRVLTHFAPLGSYNGRASAAEVLASESAYAQSDVSSESLYPFGFGDGGGGPTLEQIEKLSRFRHCEGLPPVTMSRVDSFFSQLAQRSKDLPTWVGELYLELHRGTYTTQGRLKKANRSLEARLRKTELLLSWLQLHPAARSRAVAAIQSIEPPPRAIYDVFGLDEADPLRACWTRAWQLLLLNQFHDILPGSSINWVYQDAHRDVETIRILLDQLDHCGVGALGENPGRAPEAPGNFLVTNPLGRDRQDWVDLGLAHPVYAHIPAAGWQVLASADPREPPRFELHSSVSNGVATLENAFLKAVVDAGGRVASLIEKQSGREVFSGPAGNTFLSQVDRPRHWDAWDVETEAEDMTTVLADPPDSWELVQGQAHVHGVRIRRTFGRSTITQEIQLQANSPVLAFKTSVEWRERHRILRVGFPLNLHQPKARFEIQWGHIEREVHRQTSWDQAKFETCAHKWVDLSEPDFGVALFNDGKSGHSYSRGSLRLSLLRSPTWPDGEADQGLHTFRYALMPHAGDFRQAGVIDAAYAFNHPLVATPLTSLPPVASASLFSVQTPALVLEALKPAESGDGIILRLYESWGTRGQGHIQWSQPPASLTAVDGLENPVGDPLQLEPNGALRFPFRPFQIISLHARF